ncbi:hypothetical protein BH09BAC3_BH09BAC3_06470 [soil metagenome]
MRLLIIIVASVWLVACDVKPEPLAYGKDACHSCKMTLVDEKFGGEVVTKKGKVYKFDDVNCMINFYNSQETADNVSLLLMINFDSVNQFVDAREAFYVKSTMIKSPMGSQVASFSTREQLKKYNKEWNGIELSWGELVTQYK